MDEITRNDTGFILAADSPDRRWAGVVEDGGKVTYFYVYKHGKGILGATPLHSKRGARLRESGSG